MYDSSLPHSPKALLTEHLFLKVIIVNPGHEIDDLKNAMAVTMESSPNCAEFMHKYRSKESKEMIVRNHNHPRASLSNRERYEGLRLTLIVRG